MTSNILTAAPDRGWHTAAKVVCNGLSKIIWSFLGAGQAHMLVCRA